MSYSAMYELSLNVTGDQLTFHNKKLMMYICQSYFYEREEQAGMLGDKYICVDSTLIQD